MISRTTLLEFLRAHRYAVLATRPPRHGAHAAVVGIAVSDNFELVFDTVASSRKAHNIDGDGRVALVIGGADGEERTVQYEGWAELLPTADIRFVEELYFQVFPDGRDRLSWPGIRH